MTKPLNEQVVVITGASSGIGRAAALEFARRGATVVLAARSLPALNDVAIEIRDMGGQAMVLATDVGDWDQMRQLATTAYTAYGHIDTWVNDAGVSVYATAEDLDIDEAQQIMQTNFMGVVHGVSAVLPYMARQQSGTIINIGSVESMRALPYHSVYAASKHAVKGYTEALRMELKRDHPGIAVTLIMPSAVNTPFFDHSRSKIGAKPQPFPPAYKPELVAAAIVSAAQHPQRDMYIGGAGWLFGFMQRVSPALTDQILMLGNIGFKLQKDETKPPPAMDSLYAPIPGDTGRVEGSHPELTKSSLYTPIAELAPVWFRRAIMLATPLVVLYSIFAREDHKPQRRSLFGR